MVLILLCPQIASFTKATSPMLQLQTFNTRFSPSSLQSILKITEKWIQLKVGKSLFYNLNNKTNFLRTSNLETLVTKHLFLFYSSHSIFLT